MKLLKKVDDNILKLLVGFFIFFIPIFPKFPFRIVNFTYIAIRLDDLLVAVIVTVFTLQVIRGKIKLKSLPFLKEFLIFWGIVFAALVSGMFVTQTIDIPSVSFLHAVRRVEYMIFFFIAYSSLKSVRDFKFYMYCLLASILMINVFGIGQRSFEFPAVQTMNPEYSKGRILFLTPEARLSSTFGGHYDLGAFVVFFMPIVWGLFFYGKSFIATLKEKWFVIVSSLFPILLMLYSLANIQYVVDSIPTFLRIMGIDFYLAIIVTMTLTILGFVLLYKYFSRSVIFLIITIFIGVLISTASRTSSIAFFASTGLFLLYFRKFRYLLFILIVAGTLTYIDQDLVNRWADTIQIRQIITNSKTGEEVIVQDFRSDELPAGTAYVGKKPSDETFESNNTKQELIKKATISGRLKQGPDGSTLVESDITENDYETFTAVAADISIATRFQVVWPRAIEHFLKNPLLGTGPFSVTESFDGDYFRWLAETGLLGTGMFLYIIYIINMTLFKATKKVSAEGKWIFFGIIFGVFGLLVNALLIDVFEASKVAYMFWVMMGFGIALTDLDKKELKKL